MTKLPQCLVNGKHTPGSEWERECPLNPEKAAKRSARTASSWATRRQKQGISAPAAIGEEPSDD